MIDVLISEFVFIVNSPLFIIDLFLIAKFYHCFLTAAFADRLF